MGTNIKQNVPVHTRKFYEAVRMKLTKKGFPRTGEDLITKQAAAKALGCTVRGIPRYIRHGLLIPQMADEVQMFSREAVFALVSAINSTKRGWGRRLAWARQKEVNHV